MSELISYRDLGFVDRMVIDMNEGATTEGVPMSAIFSFVGGAATFGAVELAEASFRSTATDTATTSEQPKQESDHHVGYDGLAVGALAGAAIFVGLKRKYSKLVAKIDPETY